MSPATEPCLEQSNILEGYPESAGELVSFWKYGLGNAQVVISMIHVRR